MSLIKVVCEGAFSCPHEECSHKLKKFDSVGSLNMHWTKTHSKTTFLKLHDDGRVYVRVK